jgi:hypothetical protein
MSLLDLLKRNYHQENLDLAEHFSDTPQPTFWSKWLGGMILPLSFSAYGIKCCIFKQATFYGSHRSELVLEGEVAIAFGLAWICAGAFLHFHYFWSALKQLLPYSNLGKLLSLLGFISAAAYLAWEII